MLKWDARNKEKGKHGKFDSLWKGPYKIEAFCGINDFLLKGLTRESLAGGPINGKFLKHYFT